MSGGECPAVKSEFVLKQAPKKAEWAIGDADAERGRAAWRPRGTMLRKRKQRAAKKRIAETLHY